MYYKPLRPFYRRLWTQSKPPLPKREGGREARVVPRNLGFWDPEQGIIIRVHACTEQQQEAAAYSGEKLTAPEGVPRRSPTPVLTRPCAA